MEKILIFGLVLLACIGAVNADGVGSPDEECADHGFGYGIVKWEWETGGYVVSDEGIKAGYTVGISGNDTSATWTCSPAAASAIAKGGQSSHVYAGGTSGTVYSSDLGYGISHITLCGSEEEIPEFTTIGAGLVLAGAGLYMFRKRRQ